MVGCLSCVVPLGVSVSAFFAGLAVLVVYGCWWSVCLLWVSLIVLLSVCLCCWWVCPRVLFFLFSFFFCVVVCEPRVLCVVLGLWRFVFGGLLGGVGVWGCWFLGLGWGFCFVGWLLVVLFFGGVLGGWWFVGYTVIVVLVVVFLFGVWFWWLLGVVLLLVRVFLFLLLVLGDCCRLVCRGRCVVFGFLGLWVLMWCLLVLMGCLVLVCLVWCLLWVVVLVCLWVGVVVRGGFGSVGVGGGFLEGFWGSGSGFVEPSPAGAGVGGVPAVEGVPSLVPVGASAGVLDVSDMVLPSSSFCGSVGASAGFGVVGGSGVRFGSSPGFGGSFGGVDGLLGVLGCSPVGLFPVSGVCGVGGFVDGGWVGGVDFSGVGVSGFGGVGVGSGDFVGGSGVSVFVPWLVSGLSGLDVLGSVGFGVSGFGVDVSGGVGVFGLPVGLGVSDVGGLGCWWGLSSAGLGVLGGGGFGSGLGRVLGVYGLGSGGFVPGVSGVDVSGGVVGSGVGAVVDVDGWLWRSLVFGAGLVPAGFEGVSGVGVESVVGGGCPVEGGLWGVGGLRGVYGGGAVYGGCPVGLRVGVLGSAGSVGGVVAGLSGVGGGLGLGFVAGSEGFGSPVGVVSGGGGSAGLFGRSGWGGVCGGWVDVPVGSPVLGLGVSVSEVVSVLGG